MNLAVDHSGGLNLKCFAFVMTTKEFKKLPIVYVPRSIFIEHFGSALGTHLYNAGRVLLNHASKKELMTLNVGI
jgi:hypothetical protein